MNSAARDTKDASPTPTKVRQIRRLQKSKAAPQPAIASVHTPSPMPMSRKPAQRGACQLESSGLSCCLCDLEVNDTAKVLPPFAFPQPATAGVHTPGQPQAGAI